MSHSGSDGQRIRRSLPTIPTVAPVNQTTSVSCGGEKIESGDVKYISCLCIEYFVVKF